METSQPTLVSTHVDYSPVILITVSLLTWHGLKLGVGAGL
jgi:hypothetical protein